MKNETNKKKDAGMTKNMASSLEEVQRKILLNQELDKYKCGLYPPYKLYSK